VISGASAMFARKGGATHMRWGRIYLRAFAVVYLSGVALVVSRGPQLVHLLVPGSIAAVSAVAGFRAGGGRGRRSTCSGWRAPTSGC